MTKIVSAINAFVWGLPALVLILGVGIFLGWKLSWVQLRLFPQAMGQLWKMLRPGKQGTSGGISPFQALCTALAATVGTGNIAGVAGAICLGGPGAIFWMWICGLLGMGIKYAEAVLAVRFRVKTGTGYAGGPMYTITQGLGPQFRPMAVFYCLFGIIASFGVGNAAQINAVMTGIDGVLASAGQALTGSGKLLTGIFLALVLGPMLLGGAKRIGSAAQLLVPFAAVVYIVLCLGVLAVNASRIPQAMGAILQGAVSPRAVTGGMLGSAFQALRIGCSRGVFTNEAGMGTASIAHAQAEVRHPAQQGLMGLLEVFLDTIVICTMTALAILVSGVPISYGVDAGAALTVRAFGAVYGDAAAVLISLCLCLFAVATVLGWGLYGARCAEFLFGTKAWRLFAWMQIVSIILGAAADTAAVWQFSETVNGLMAIPNLITLAVLSPELVRLTNEYRRSGFHQPEEVCYYADFHQCQSLRTLSHAEIPPSGRGSQERGKKDLPPEHRSA